MSPRPVFHPDLFSKHTTGIAFELISILCIFCKTLTAKDILWVWVPQEEMERCVPTCAEAMKCQSLTVKYREARLRLMRTDEKRGDGVVLTDRATGVKPVWPTANIRAGYCASGSLEPRDEPAVVAKDNHTAALKLHKQVNSLRPFKLKIIRTASSVDLISR